MYVRINFDFSFTYVRTSLIFDSAIFAKPSIQNLHQKHKRNNYSISYMHNTHVANWKIVRSPNDRKPIPMHQKQETHFYRGVLREFSHIRVDDLFSQQQF